MTPEKMLKVSTRNHQMKVLRDDGLYRHIRFQEPGTSIWHFDLVTWPGHLVITGDLEDFHFARIADMFEFFRGPVGRTNPHYWAEKLRGPVKTKSFSSERFKQQVLDHFRYAQDWFPGPHAPLWRAIRQDVLEDAEIYNEDAAHQALANFSYPDPDSAQVFEFTDSWEWELKDWDFHYLVSLNAIVWGIHQYDTAQRAAA